VRRTFQVHYVTGSATALARACRNGNLEMVRWLVADVGDDPSVEADGGVRWHLWHSVALFKGLRLSIAENSAVGTRVGALTWSDVDAVVTCIH
jgi:hypothetical protein